MEKLQSLADQIDFAARNTCYNLDFIPDDKFDWKPEPTAKSVLEIVNHICGNMVGGLGFLTTGEWDPNYTPATDRDSAKKAITDSYSAYSAKVRTLKPEDLEGTFSLGEQTFPRSFLLGVSVFDAAHHHGQISYLQTLLGDEENHFDMEAMGLIS